MTHQDVHDEAEPPLDDLYSGEITETRRQRAIEVLVDAVQDAEDIVDPGKRALWVAQLSVWLPENRRRQASLTALAALPAVALTQRAEVTTRVLRTLSGQTKRTDLKAAAVRVTQTLRSEEDRAHLRIAASDILNISLPPMDELLPSLPTDCLRLQALHAMVWDPPLRLIRRCLTVGLTAFTDPGLRAEGCVELLRRIDAPDDSVLSAIELERVVEVAITAADVNLANEVLAWLQLVADDVQQNRVVAAKLAFNGGLTDPAKRAAGMFRSIGLGLPDAANERFAREGLAALDAVADEAVRTELIGAYVGSIPGTPPWDLDHVLAAVTSINDERLQARALNFAASLPPVTERAFALGLQLQDPWARAAVIFGWGNWSGTPVGFTRRRWAETRLHAARAVPAGSARARYLAQIAGESRGHYRAQVATEAWLAALDVPSPRQRTPLLYLLAADGIADRAEAVREALASAWNITDPYQRYDALARLGYLLSAPDFAHLLGKILYDVTSNAESIDFIRLCEPPGLDLGISWQ